MLSATLVVTLSSYAMEKTRVAKNQVDKAHAIALAIWIPICPNVVLASRAPNPVHAPTIQKTVVVQLMPDMHSEWSFQSTPVAPELLRQAPSDTHFVAWPAVAAPILVFSGTPGWLVLTVVTVTGVVAVIYFWGESEQQRQIILDAIEELFRQLEQAQADYDAAVEAGATEEWLIDLENYIYDLDQAINDLFLWLDLL